MATTAGIELPWNKKKPEKAKPNPYESAITQGGEDYDEIMQRYRDFVAKPDGSAGLKNQYQELANQRPNAPLLGQFQNLANSKYTPDKLSYNRTAELDTGFRNMRELSETGGYSPQGIQELRARGVSPLRSMYGQAQNEMNRNRSLQGGYSPSFNAASSKNTRDMAGSIADQLSNVNAGIAQNVASNRLSAAPQHAAFAQGEQRDIDSINKTNVENKNYAAGLNRNTSQGALQSMAGMYAQNDATRLGALGGMYSSTQNNSNQMLDAIHGMRSTYATQPGNAALYGQQAATNKGLELQDKSINNAASSQLIQAYRPGGINIGNQGRGIVAPGGNYGLPQNGKPRQLPSNIRY